MSHHSVNARLARLSTLPIVSAVASEPENELSRQPAWAPRPRVRRRSARVDVAAGTVVALLTLLLAPGLAVAAVVAVAMLALCGLSALLSRQRARRGIAGGARTAVRFRPSEHAGPPRR
jgi:hypothetical protein